MGVVLGSILVIVVLIMIIGFIKTSNKFTRAFIKIEEAQAGIEIALIKRYDVLTQSMEVTRAYAQHEQALFVNLAGARRGMSVQETQYVMDNQADVARRIMAVAENYPQLRSNELFVTLQNQIADTNEHLSASKRLYNANVSMYNQDIAVFPGSVVASMTGKHRVEFYREENVMAKSEVNIRFN